MSKPKHGSSGKSIANPQDAHDSELSSKISGWCEDCQCSHDPSPLLALRRARVWQKRSPKNKWIEAINLLILAVFVLALNVLPVMASRRT